MKALVLDRSGSFDNLHLAEIPRPEPGPGKVCVRVEAVGLNPADYKLLLDGDPAWTFPMVLGLDVAGVVDSAGPEVERWRFGDRVFYHGDLRRPGGLAEYTIAPAHVMARIPDGVTSVDAAALPCAGLTAYQALFRKLVITGQVWLPVFARELFGGGEIAIDRFALQRVRRPASTVLIQGGAGGVGGFGVQLAAHAGSKVITTCSPSHAGYVRQLGAHYVIDYHTEDVRARVLEITHGRGVDAIVDTVGRQTATEGLEMLAFDGGIACVEALPDLSRWRTFHKAISVHEIALGAAYSAGDRLAQEDLARMAGELVALVATGRISSLVGEVIPLDAVPDALRRLSERHVRGKIVARID
jgi:NADPH2:quinone reductase